MPIISTDIDSGAASGYSLSTSGAHLTIKPGVTITCNTSGAAIIVGSGSGQYIDNGGHLNGGSGVTTDAVNMYILNEPGAVMEGLYGVWLFGGGNTLENLGSLFGNTGVYATSTASTGSFIVNRGDISATIGINIDGGPATIINSGLIAGFGESINAVRGSKIKVTNSGTLDGDVSLLDTTSNLINTGAIHGDLIFGDGANAYNGRAGTITGKITGGAGIDKLFAGNDGEELAGGKGHDDLYGGSGADSFDLASLSINDIDQIHGFKAGTDHIQLDHAVFTHLHAGATPTLAVAAAANSPTDFLFYDATTGTLNYDPDGSGSHISYTLANLGPGLTLAGSDIVVI